MISVEGNSFGLSSVGHLYNGSRKKLGPSYHCLLIKVPHVELEILVASSAQFKFVGTHLHCIRNATYCS